MMDEVADPRLGEAYVYCETLLREHDPDRWLASLFAPWSHRKHLHALYAFSLEMARVREIVSDPMPGEIRFQWWRDALEGEERGDISAHPVASALLDTVKRFKLPRAALTNLVDARTFDLYDDPMPGMRQLEGYGGETSSALIRMACLILADGRDPGGADAAGHAGLAYAITGLLRALPWHSARGQVYVPGDVLKEAGATAQDLIAGARSEGVAKALAHMRAVARKHLAAAMDVIKTVEPVARPAFLPLTMVEPYLAAMEKPGYDPFKTVIQTPQWRRQWRLWMAARRW
jgi:phytoene synthase